MPYIAIRAYPKTQAQKEAIVEKINTVLMETWGCPQEAVNISVEDIPPEEWKETVFEREMEPKMDKMMILAGEKRYQLP